MPEDHVDSTSLKHGEERAGTDYSTISIGQVMGAENSEDISEGRPPEIMIFHGLF